MGAENEREAKRRVPHRIETQRLVLRCYEPADAEALRVKCAESRAHLLPWLPWAELDPQTLDEKLELVLNFRSNYDSGKNCVMGVFDKQTGELIGGTGLHPSGGQAAKTAREIGYWVCASHEGQGYVTEAVKALLLIAFRVLRVQSIVIRCDPDNVRSLAIPERLSFVREGLLRYSVQRSNGDYSAAYRYSITGAEYAASAAHAEWLEDRKSIVAFDALGRPVELRKE